MVVSADSGRVSKPGHRIRPDLLFLVPSQLLQSHTSAAPRITLKVRFISPAGYYRHATARVVQSPTSPDCNHTGSWQFPPRHGSKRTRGALLSPSFSLVRERVLTIQRSLGRGRREPSDQQTVPFWEMGSCCNYGMKSYSPAPSSSPSNKKHPEISAGERMHRTNF